MTKEPATTKKPATKKRHDPMEEKLDSARVHRKIAEAQSFLGKMTEQDGLMISHGFAHCLSAFLTAGRSVCYDVEVWRKKWENALTSEENHLHDFMRNNRDDEVHHSGAALTVEKEPVKVGGGQYSDKSGTIEVFGPTIALDPDMPNAVVYKTEPSTRPRKLAQRIWRC